VKKKRAVKGKKPKTKKMKNEKIAGRDSVLYLLTALGEGTHMAPDLVMHLYMRGI
jgi:hypothetical protein